MSRASPFSSKDGVLRANVHVFGEFTTPLSRAVESIEEDMQIPAGHKQYLADWNERKSLGQKAVPLRSGTYRLVLACKDDVSGNAHKLRADGYRATFRC
jgi:hypothetical protein